MEKFIVINTHVNIDIVNLLDNSNGYSLKAIDILPVAAAPIILLDDAEDISNRPILFSTVRRLKSKKALPYSSYTKEALIDALTYRWVANMETEEMEKLLSGIKLIEGFDSEGNAIFNEALCDTYRNIFQKPTFHSLNYTGTRGFSIEKNENLQMVHKILNYPPFNGLRIWSWKCQPEDYQPEYPCELCCVGKNEWFDRSFAEVKTIEEWESIRDEKANRGTVTRAWWDFGHVIQDGDIVIYRDWKNDLIVGIGVFKGDYNYKPEKPNYRSCRNIEWLSVEHYPSPTHIGEGNTSPMEIDDPKKLKDLIPIILEAMSK